MASRSFSAFVFAPIVAFAIGCGGGMAPANGAAEGEEDAFFSLLSVPPGHSSPPALIPEPEPTFGACVGEPSRAAARRRRTTNHLCCYTTPSVFTRSIQKKSPEARACYEEALARDPNVRGRVVSKFTIEEDGSVLGACDAGSTVGDPKLVECVLRVMTTVTFMAMAEDDPCPPVTLNYPILFQPTPAD
jgi:hypothetical protein